MKESLATRLGLLAPTQGLVLAVLMVPAAYLVWLSFHASSFGMQPRWVGLDNYARILADVYFWRALGNTAAIVLVVVHVELLLGLGMALLFAAGLPMRRLRARCLRTMRYPGCCPCCSPSPASAAPCCEPCTRSASRTKPRTSQPSDPC